MPFLPAGPKERAISKVRVAPGKLDLAALPALAGWVPTSETTTFWLTANPYGESFEHLKYLVHYPYGCIEQTTSSVFPQIYLKEIIAASPSVQDKQWLTAKVDDAVNAGIGRLVLFSLPDGSFSYWPGSRDHADEWSNLYAGHFLIEAKRQGYFVPRILDDWVAYEHGRATTADTDWRTRAYRLYLQAQIQEWEHPAG